MTRSAARRPERFAEGTTVAPEKTEMEIRALLRKHRAGEVYSHDQGDRIAFGFAMGGRRVLFRLALPPASDKQFAGARDRERARDAEVRRLWRALLLTIKSKLEVVASGIETFDESFLSQIVLATGGTLGELILPRLTAGVAPRLELPPPAAAPTEEPGS